MKQTFESAVTRIEEISKLLEDKNISLDDSIKLFEEGTRLAGYCNTCLTQAEARVTELSQQEHMEESPC